jgi:hypothetical protein
MTELPTFNIALDLSTCAIIGQELGRFLSQSGAIRFDDVADDGWMDTRQAAEYVALTVAALRRHTAARTIPFEQDARGGKSGSSGPSWTTEGAAKERPNRPPPLPNRFQASASRAGSPVEPDGIEPTTSCLQSSRRLSECVRLGSV